MHILLPETDNCPSWISRRQRMTTENISLNQLKGENDHGKYFIISLHERMLPDPAGIKPATSWSSVRYTSNCATKADWGSLVCITKTCLYNFDPLKPHFYIVKLGFTGVYIIFLISAQNIDCGYWLEPPQWGSSNEYPQSMFWTEIWNNIRVFYLKNFGFWRWNFLYIWIGMFS